MRMIKGECAYVSVADFQGFFADVGSHRGGAVKEIRIGLVVFEM
jgi:hypothetical protein